MASTQSGGAARDGIDLLLDDHKRVQKLFREFQEVDRSDDEALRELVETACVELQIHSMLEEEIFYPAARAHVGAGNEALQDLLNKAEVEHEMVDELISRLQELDPDDAMYSAYFSVLADYVKHHVKEEEKELFPAVRQMPLDLAQLGDDMRTRREELFAELEADEETDEEADEDTEGSSEDDSAVPEEQDEGFEDEQEQIDIASRTKH